MKVIETEEIFVELREVNFDIACMRAYRKAILTFGINEDGHSQKIKDFERSTDSIEVKFKSYTCTNGQNHGYLFQASVIRFDD